MEYKRHMLAILDSRCGIEVREGQLVDDFRLSVDVNARREDVCQALSDLKERGHADTRVIEYTGRVWKVTPEGTEAAKKIQFGD